MSGKLWENKNPSGTNIYQFIKHVNIKFNKNFGSYDDLYDWSINNIEEFWGEVWHYTKITGTPFDKVVDESAPMFPRPAFFKGAELNFAENLLFPAIGVDAGSIAVISATESSRKVTSWAQLREQVRIFQAAMITQNLKAGDRVAAYVANHVEALVAMLAATSLGAIWTAVSTDTGVHAVVERLKQIEPVLLFVDNGAAYNGKVFPVLNKAKEIIDQLPSLKDVVILPTVEGLAIAEPLQSDTAKVLTLDKFLSLGASDSKLEFKKFPADHPVYILYSSGTTGAPKCIVHGAIGTLIQHKKEHQLNCDLKPGSRMLYFTTVTWMMWHWLVSALASGATIVLYDGSPFRYKSSDHPSGSIVDDIAMAKVIEELDITHFGTSAKYLSMLEQKQLFPTETLNLQTLEAIYSTGSPLSPSTFSWIYKAFPSTINLGSITGGTDIVSLFGAPSLISPVYIGEIQKPGLGMAVRAWDYSGKDITDQGEAGDLVCVKAFPCQPVFFWGPTGDSKYKSSYFDKFEGVWAHGDFIRFNPITRGLFMLGRSDGILKPQGVRFGSAEIYNVLLEWFPMEIADALCIGRRRENDNDETVVLFVKMTERSTYQFSEELANKIKSVIRKELSARHVPGIIDECPEIPVTSNGKKVEAAVKQILCGLNVKISASVANADCLEWYRQWNLNH